MKNKKKNYKFLSESKQLLDIMINSLYSNKDIFFRELISNSADAIEKLHFLSISNAKIYENDSKTKIQITTSKINKSITISDNGIGMTEKEVIENLGTIAKSGTKSFLKSIKKISEENNKLIGKFGVGFYSSFIVAKKVLVRTRTANVPFNEGIMWESEGKGEFTVNNCTKKNRGTSITLYLKEKELDFLENQKIKKIVNKYTDHISIPIEIQNYDKKSKTYSWKKINTAKSLWTLKKSEISDKDYKKFYKKLTNDIHEPILWIHNHVEGKLEYINLLYIPSKAPWDIWNKENKSGLKLYIKKVFIMEEIKQFLPNYLRFVKGIIDTHDLPLNISREILQENKIIKKLKKSITKRILKNLQNLEKKNPKKYLEFWNEFGSVFKEGPAEDIENKEIISSLLRFSSISTKKNNNKISLINYIDNMLEKQEKIFYITSDSYDSAYDNPHLELFKKKGIDVLILTDRIDEWMMNYLTEFKNKKFQSVSINDSSINRLTEENEKNKKNINNNDCLQFIKKIKKILGEKVKDVRLTYRLTETPAIVLTDSNEMSTQMEKLFLAAGQNVNPIKYILAINPNHKLIEKIKSIKDEKLFKNWIDLLLEQTLLAERGSLENPSNFIKLMNNLYLTN
ncbi:Chaperone protein HtpG [Buchnera aphidicola (Tetraneura ulmi)]|uniref:molecular chaperone HtpG n=1 Tax=Buchnera aphidicola TaxID=9 RepID=UPI0034648977